jgi:CDP-ribitol ribitolphosphotransferase
LDREYLINMKNVTYPLVSVITPVFNTEAYLQACIDSVFAQAEKNIELILVDDGSSDNSVSIAKAASELDPRIHFIQQENSGPGAARNLGISLAKGKYLFFLDSDDLIPAKGFSMLIETAEKHGSEITCGILQSFNSQRRWILPALINFQNLSIFNIALQSFPNMQQHISPCGKLYLRELICRTNIRFLDKCFWGEDAYFVLNLMRSSSRITLVSVISYQYRGREGGDTNSLTSQIRPELFADLERVASMLNSDFKEIDTPEIKDVRDLHFLRSMRYHLARLIKSQPEPSVLESAMQSCQRFLETTQEATTIKFEPANSLAFDLLRLGAFHAGKELLDKPISSNMLINALALLEVEDDIRAVRSIARASLSLIKKPVTGKLESAQKVIKAVSAETGILAKKPISSPSSWHWRIKVAMARTVSGISRRFLPDLWLVGERAGDAAQDTGYHFFSWACENKPKKNVWFVTKKSSHEKMPTHLAQRTLRYGSLRHFIYFFAARALIYNDSYKDVFYHWQKLAAKKQLPKAEIGVFIQHGIIGTSRIQGYYNYPAMLQRQQPADLFVVSSSREKSFVTQGLGHPNNNVVITGLSRFDKLPIGFHARACAKPIILFVPTWRNWLRWNTEEAFVSSRFFKETFAWLRSVELQRTLEKNGVKMELLMHHAFSKFSRHFQGVANENIRIADMNSCNVQEKLIESSLLVTDYSSIGFDFAYMEKPVVYFQFDREEFLAARGGGFFEMENDLPGPVVRTTQKLETEIEKIIASDWMMDDASKDKLHLFFDSRDTNNSSRIFNAIDDRLRSQSTKSDFSSRLTSVNAT